MTAVGSLELSLGRLRPEAAVNLLVICPLREDHVKLREVCSILSWNLHEAGTYHEALECLGRYQIEIVICECLLPDGNWKDLLSIMAPLAESPRLIVISAHADDLLWAEVLNLGGYDMLAKPLKLQEVARTVALAWRNWKDEREKSKTAAPVAPAFLMRISAAP
jgi:DNA-binding NtrC family response regulator